jgi:hypothetical protein
MGDGMQADQSESFGAEDADHTSAVPAFRSYYASAADMDNHQRAFYMHFREQFRLGNPIDVKDQWSYVFVALYELVDELATDTPQLVPILRRALGAYPSSPVADFATRWLADIYFLDGDFQGGWDVLVPHHMSLEEYINLAPLVEDSRISSAMARRWMAKTQNGLTRLMSGRGSDVDRVAQDLLDAAHAALGRSVIFDLWKRLTRDREVGSHGPAIANEFGRYITQSELDSTMKIWDRGLYESGRTAFNGADLSAPFPIQWPFRYRSTYWFATIARPKLQALFRDAENIVRGQIGVSPVGEGWVSEAALLHEIRKAFPDQQVVHQGRPAWLGQQSLDIYFPSPNIGIEYQGLQHSQPVDLFGGLPAFEKQLERDARKRALCSVNGCELIEVHPGYDLGAVIELVDAALRNAGNR